MAKKERDRIWWVVIVVMVLLAGLALAQASTKTQTAEIDAETLTINWDTNVWVFSGPPPAVLTLTGPQQATLTSPRMSVRFSAKMDRIIHLEATGPVRLELVTKPDAEGNRRRIVATAKQRAEYSESTQKLVLHGGAEATVVALPEGPESQRAFFSGEVMEANLKTSQLTVQKAHLEVTTPLEED